MLPSIDFIILLFTFPSWNHRESSFADDIRFVSPWFWIASSFSFRGGVILSLPRTWSQTGSDSVAQLWEVQHLCLRWTGCAMSPRIKALPVLISRQAEVLASSQDACEAYKLPLFGFLSVTAGTSSGWAWLWVCTQQQFHLFQDFPQSKVWATCHK